MTSEMTRAELLNAIAKLGTLFPDWRLGQTLANLAMAAGRSESGAIWELEDCEALLAAQRLIEHNSQKQKKETSRSLEQTVPCKVSTFAI
mgnify:CR=1 FL=1